MRVRTAESELASVVPLGDDVTSGALEKLLEFVYLGQVGGGGGGGDGGAGWGGWGGAGWGAVW